MREREETRVITTEFICGGMEYKVEAQVVLMGKCIMFWSILKVWAMGKNKYVRIYPYDMQVWVDSMENDIDKALKEEIL